MCAKRTQSPFLDKIEIGHIYFVHNIFILSFKKLMKSAFAFVYMYVYTYFSTNRVFFIYSKMFKQILGPFLHVPIYILQIVKLTKINKLLNIENI